MTLQYSQSEFTAQRFYDDIKTSKLYTSIWSEEHLHYGIFTQPTDSIHDAAQRTVETLAQNLKHLSAKSRIIDLGAGYGGSARYLAKNFGCSIVCLNISPTQNEQNRRMNREENLDHLIDVKEGSFENIPYPVDSFDIVWSQDAILHSDNRRKVLTEVKRILRPGGEFIFTDPMQDDSCSSEILQSALDRLGLKNMGSIGFYQQTLQEIGFEKISVVDLTEHVITHYFRYREEMQNRYHEIAKITSQEYLDSTLESTASWLECYQNRVMQWRMLHFCLNA